MNRYGVTKVEKVLLHRIKLHGATDIMCVLLLSGMQKEDFNVSNLSMLTKLQRRNVNTDDMNNEELLRTCIPSSDNNSNTNTTKAQQSIILKSDILDDYKTYAAFEALKRSRNLENVSYAMSTDHKMSQFHENDKKTSKENSDKNKSYVDEGTKYPDIKLEMVSKYLQHIQTKPQAGSIKEQESKRSTTDNIQSSEIETPRVIANFLTKRRNISTKSITTQTTLNIEDSYEKLSLRKQDMKENPITDFQRSFKHLTTQRNFRNTPIEIIQNESDMKREELNLPNYPNLSDMLTLLNIYKSFNAFDPDAEILNNFNGKIKESLKSRNPYLRLQITESTTSKTNVGPKYEISRDMIKEIAESVKEMILRDLRKEFHETTLTTTTITSTTHNTIEAESTIQTTLKKGSTKTHDSVMNKFLELFEEIKSLNQETIVIPSENEKGIKNKDTRPNFDVKVYPHITKTGRIPSNIIQRQLPIYANKVFYRIKQQNPTVNSENILNFAPQVRNGIFKKPEPTELSKGLLPITMQTNNIEIPPLGIPLDKSQNLIRENIIITTTVPYRIAPIKINNGGPTKKGNQHKGTQYLEESNYIKAYKSKQVHPLSEEPFKPPTHHSQSNSKENVIRFTLNNNEHTKYNAGYYEKINIGKYTPRADSDENRHKEIPRFHEELEEVERDRDYPKQNKYTDKNDCCDKKFRYSEAMVDCCNRKIMSRHQMSLNNMKMKSYDDTHFKKFLQSQQKVTEMLEKILGDKSRNVQSVETA